MARRYPKDKNQLDRTLAMEPSLRITHARLRDWYEIQGQFEAARQVAIPFFPEFDKIEMQPGKIRILAWNSGSCTAAVRNLRGRFCGADPTGKCVGATG
jgi:hypothetical protein